MKKIIIALLFLLPSLSHAANLLPVSTSYIPADSIGNNTILHGDFSVSTNWALTGEATISGGQARLLSSAGVLSQVETTGYTPMALGNIYQIAYTIVSATGAGMNDNEAVTWPIVVGLNTVTYTTPRTALIFKRVGTTDIVFDDVTCKKISNAIGTKSFYSGSFIQNLPGTLSGDTAGVWSIVSGPDNGKAYRITNTGSVNVIVVLTPTKSAVAGRSYRLLGNFRQVSGTGTASFGLTGATATNISGSSFLPYVAVGKATNTTDKYTITVPPDCVIEFYHPKLLDNTGGGGFNFNTFDFTTY